MGGGGNGGWVSEWFEGKFSVSFCPNQDLNLELDQAKQNVMFVCVVI